MCSRFIALSKHRGGAYAMWQWNGDRYNNQNADLISNHIASIYNDSIYEDSLSDENEDVGGDDDDVTIMSQSDCSISFNTEGVLINLLSNQLPSLKQKKLFPLFFVNAMNSHKYWTLRELISPECSI